jgi:hypothetical protein
MLFFGSRFSPANGAMTAWRERAGSERWRLAEFEKRPVEIRKALADFEIRNG